MKALIPVALLAGVLIGGNVQADAMKDLIEADRRMTERTSGYSQNSAPRASATQRAREANQDMRDDLIIMDTMSRQLHNGVAPLIPALRPRLGY